MSSGGSEPDSAALPARVDDHLRVLHLQLVDDELDRLFRRAVARGHPIHRLLEVHRADGLLDDQPGLIEGERLHMDRILAQLPRT